MRHEVVSCDLIVRRVRQQMPQHQLCPQLVRRAHMIVSCYSFVWQFGEVWACLDASSSEATLMQLAAKCCNYIVAKPKLEELSFEDK